MLPRGGPDRDLQVIWSNVTCVLSTNKETLPGWLPLGVSPAVHLCIAGTWPSLTAAPTDALTAATTDALTQNIHYLFWECYMAWWAWGLVCSSLPEQAPASLMAEGALYGPLEGCKTIQLQCQWGIISIIKLLLWEVRNKVNQKNNCRSGFIYIWKVYWLVWCVCVFLKNEKMKKVKTSNTHQKPLLLFGRPLSGKIKCLVNTAPDVDKIVIRVNPTFKVSIWGKGHVDFGTFARVFTFNNPMLFWLKSF